MRVRGAGYISAIHFSLTFLPTVVIIDQLCLLLVQHVGGALLVTSHFPSTFSVDPSVL